MAKKKVDIDPKSLIGKVVQLTKKTKVSSYGTIQILPPHTLGRVSGTHHKTVRLANPLTGEVFARSVPVAHVELAPTTLSSVDLADADILRASRPELETAVIRVRAAIRDMKGSAEAGDERLERLFRLLPEYGLPGYDAAATAKVLDADPATSSIPLATLPSEISLFNPPADAASPFDPTVESPNDESREPVLPSGDIEPIQSEWEDPNRTYDPERDSR